MGPQQTNIILMILLKKNDSVIVYTDAWGKFNKNENSGLSICPGNYFDTPAGMRLDASGNVVINGKPYCNRRCSN